MTYRAKSHFAPQHFTALASLPVPGLWNAAEIFGGAAALASTADGRLDIGGHIGPSRSDIPAIFPALPPDEPGEQSRGGQRLHQRMQPGARQPPIEHHRRQERQQA